MVWNRPKQPAITLGTYGFPLLRRSLRLGPELLRTHKHVMGVTGQGKSKLLAATTAQLIGQGVGCALLDPHADLADDVLGLLADQGFFGRPDAFDRLLYLDFSRTDAFLPFNVLKTPYDVHSTAQHIVEVCTRAWPALADGQAPQFENILLAAVVVLVDNHLPLTALPQLLTEKGYREELLRQVSDPQVVHFFHDRFDHWGKDAPLMIESTLRRVFLLSFSPTLRYSLGQRENILTFRRLMDESVSLIVNLGGLDEQTQRFLGCLLTVGFEVAALSRADIPEEQRTPYHLILDEFSQFSAQSEEALSRVLSLARKYGLFLTMAHQTWSQLSQRLQGAIQNTVQIAFKLGRDDAVWAAPRFGHFNPYDIKHEVSDETALERTHPVFFSLQESFESWAQALEQLKPQEAFVRIGNKTTKIRTVRVPPARCTPTELARIKERYATRLLRPRAVVSSAVDHPSRDRPGVEVIFRAEPLPKS